MANFFEDRRAARGAEILVKECLAQLTDNYTFEDVADAPEYYYKGDILAIDRNSGKRIYIEVKDDSRIAQTKNVLCEDKVWYDRKGAYGKGNMSADYNIYCVVSR